jgi:hypothetical protein
MTVAEQAVHPSRMIAALAALVAIVVAAPALAAAARLRPVVRLGSVDFLRRGTAFGAAYLTFGPEGRPPQLVRTSDGGRIWKAVGYLPAPPLLGGVSALAMSPAGRTGLLVLNDGPTAGSLPVSLWRTTDGGLRWRRTGTTTLLTGALAVAAAGNGALAINGSGAGPIASLIELAPAIRVLARLPDPDRLGAVQPGMVTAASLLADDHRAAVASAAYVWTRRMGGRRRIALFTYAATSPYRSWHSLRIALPARTKAVSAAAFGTPRSGVAVLDVAGRNLLESTANAGRTWQRAAAPAPADVRQLDAAGPSSYAILGGAGTIWLSSDGGRHWARRSPTALP